MKGHELKINKLIILAAGISSRMKNDSDDDLNLPPQLLSDAVLKPKSMIRIGENDKPFLDYLIDNAIEAAYNDIVLVVNEKDDTIKNYYSAKNLSGIKISFAVQKIPAGKIKPLGTADALLTALILKRDWKGSKFAICNSDNLYSVKALKQISETEFANAMIDYDRESLKEESSRVEKFAVTRKDDEGFLVDIIEKPSPGQIELARDRTGSVGVSMNLFAFSYDMIYPYLQSVPFNENRQEKELPTAIKMMLNEIPKSLFCYPWKERVPDLTKKKDILNVQKFLKKN